MSPQNRGEFKWRLGVVFAVLVMTWVLWQGSRIVLLTFIGVLLGIFLGAVARQFSRWFHLPYMAALPLVGVLILGLLALAGWLIVPSISSELSELQKKLPEAWNHFVQKIQNQGWLGKADALSFEQATSGLLDAGQVVSSFKSYLLNLASILAGFLIILFVGIYAAGDPRLYMSGIVRLFPTRQRSTVESLLKQLECTLEHWLVGQCISITTVGVLTGLGLWLLGAPLPLALGFLAGVLELLPRIGPFLAAIPAVLLAFLQNGRMALYVMALYLGLQVFESYVLLPLVQRRAVHVPPVLAIFALSFFGYVFGFLGLLVAIPFTAAVLVLMQECYVKSYLEAEPSSGKEAV